LPYNKGKLTQHTEASGKCGLWVSCPHTPYSPPFPDLQSPVYRVTTLPVIAEDVVRAARDVWENVFGIVFFSVVSYPQSQSSRPPFYMVFFTSSFLLINLFDFLFALLFYMAYSTVADKLATLAEIFHILIELKPNQ